MLEEQDLGKSEGREEGDKRTYNWRRRRRDDQARRGETTARRPASWQTLAIRPGLGPKL